MPNGSGTARGGRTIWWAGFLSLALGVGAGSGGLGAEPRLPADATVSPYAAAPAAAASPDAEVDLTPAPHDVLVRPGDPLNEALAGVRARLDELARLVGKFQAQRDELAALEERNRHLLARLAVLEAESGLPDALKLAKEPSNASDGAARAKGRDLVEELIAQRRQNAELRADLAEAKAERAQMEQAVRAKEAALVAWIGGLHDELAERAAQLADAGAGRAQAEARLEAQARALQAERVRAARQLAGLQDRLRERDRQMAAARTEGDDLRQRLDAAQAELKRQGTDNARLAAELGTARRAADVARVMARDELAAIEDPTRTLHVATGDAPPDPSEQPAGLLPATLAGVLPAMPYPKPRLEADALDAWAPASDTADGEAPAAAIAVTEDDAWIQASLRDVAAGNREPTTDRAPFVTPDSPEVGDAISTAALLADPLGPGRMGESSADQSTPLLEWGDRAVLFEAAARLADALRTTRDEAMFLRRERVFTIDVEERAFAANPGAAPVPLDPALDVYLFTARSELVGDSKGGIRFYPDGRSTGGRIELELLGERAAVNVRWSTGIVTVER